MCAREALCVCVFFSHCQMEVGVPAYHLRILEGYSSRRVDLSRAMSTAFEEASECTCFRG